MLPLQTPSDGPLYAQRSCWYCIHWGNMVSGGNSRCAGLKASHVAGQPRMGWCAFFDTVGCRGVLVLDRDPSSQRDVIGFFRRSNLDLTLIASAATLSALMVASGATFANSYAIVDLGAKTFAMGIDAKGEIAGGLEFRANSRHERVRAQVYGNGRWWHLQSGHENTYSVAIDKGRAVGNIDERPVIWAHHAGPVMLALPGSNVFGMATGINSSGNVAGYYEDNLGDYENHCFVWYSSSGRSQDLGLLGKGDKCEAYGIDNRGRVYGRAISHPGYRWFAFVWHDNHFHRLPELVQGTEAMAVAGNKSGQVIGNATAHGGDGEYAQHAVLWQDGVVEDLGPDDGDWQGYANAINDAGTIVGQAIEYGGDGDERHAVRFVRGGRFVELVDEVVNREGWALLSATGISPAGVIVGWGVHDDGKIHGFELIPQ